MWLLKVNFSSYVSLGLYVMLITSLGNFNYKYWPLKPASFWISFLSSTHTTSTPKPSTKAPNNPIPYQTKPTLKSKCNHISKLSWLLRASWLALPSLIAACGQWSTLYICTASICVLTFSIFQFKWQQEVVRFDR